MKATMRFMTIVLLMIVVGAFLYAGGCSKSDKEGPKAGQAVAASVQLCTVCGQIKGSDLCCKPDQTLCSKCGLVKGAPGCCKIPAGAQTAAICTKCGQIKGSDVCCQPNQTLCSKCGLVKGSPGCCKLPKS